MNSINDPVVLVTGGSGFLGQNIVRELLADDSPLSASAIRIFDLHAPEESLLEQGVEYIRGDIRDAELINKALSGVDVVIHSAAIVDWGTKKRSEVLDINYQGTLNIIEGCKSNGVQVLVYTSSLDAVYHGKPLVDVDESLEYPAKFHSAYCESKALSEIAVLDLEHSVLKAAVIRPGDVYGEGDPYHIGSLIEMAKNGFYVRLGNGESRCQHVYVGNVAYAHLQLAAALWKGERNPHGEIFFITDAEPTNFFKFFDSVVFESGYKIWPQNFWIPRRIAYAMGAMAELIAWLWRPIKHYNPKFSRFAVEYTCNDFTFSSKKAQELFDFKPKYTHREAFEKTVQYYREQKDLN